VSYLLTIIAEQDLIQNFKLLDIKMRTTKVVHIVSCHAEGEVGNVIVGGVAPPPGDSIWEQSQTFNHSV
jgi:hypothetical protein